MGTNKTFLRMSDWFSLMVPVWVILTLMPSGIVLLFALKSLMHENQTDQEMNKYVLMLHYQKSNYYV